MSRLYSTKFGDPAKEQTVGYWADAEVDVKFVSGVDERLQQPGIVFYFELQGNWASLVPRQPQSLVGHFDPKGTRPPNAGSAHLCLHNLIGSQHLPLGSPLVVGQRFKILRGAEAVGICHVTAVFSGKAIFLCRPVMSSFDEQQLKFSRREMF